MRTPAIPARARFVLSLLSAGACCCAGALAIGASQKNSAPAGCVGTAARMAEAVRQVHEKQRNVGLSVAVMRGGAVVFARQLGLADLENQVPVGPATRFGIASVTKAFTGVTVLRLADRNLIDLDEPIQRYVPSFAERPEGPITPRHLLAHLSGLPQVTERTPTLFATRYATATDAVAVFRDTKLVAPPGSKYVYSSSNYNLLAAAVEHITGRPFTAVVQDEVLSPLALRDTSFDDVLRPIARRARRYSFYHPWTYAESDSIFAVPAWDYSFNPGGGNMLSTPADLVRFALALARPGLLSAEAVKRLRRPQTIGGVQSTWSFGWIVAPADAGRAKLSISGSNPGLQASLAVWPDEDLAVAVLANTWGVGSRSGEMVDLVDVLAGRCMAWK